MIIILLKRRLERRPRRFLEWKKRKEEICDETAAYYIIYYIFHDCPVTQGCRNFFNICVCCVTRHIPLSIDWMNESKPENFLCPKSPPRLFFFIYFGNWRSLKKETAFKLSVKRRSSWITSSNLCWFSGIFFETGRRDRIVLSWVARYLSANLKIPVRTGIKMFFFGTSAAIE